ncbi:MAG: endopeptidase La [Anaerolineae bacterium]|nr:endopeptidase La [Anaerolineae bacterium]
MQEKTSPVFVAATANSIEALPPELLRKGRFDEIFFIGLPSHDERREIFEVHLRRVREMRLREFDLDVLAGASDGYSGAEIEQAIIEAMHTAFEQRREFQTGDILGALETVVPLSRTMEEQIEQLQQWAESGRARVASGDMARRIKALPTRRDRTLRAEIEAAGMPEEAKNTARREMERMASLPKGDTERTWIRTYLDWLVGLPWSRATEDNLDLAHVRAVLDADHYGLGDVKDRVIEYLAMRALRARRRAAPLLSGDGKAEVRPERAGVILCFVGPSGVGKTSLGASIARAMGREFARLSLGGIRDEAEIRGFRRTYVGAQPGRFIQTIRRVGARNPLIMLDEIDKLVRGAQGDPAAALLEALDPEQNREFRDHYLEVPFDLSGVLFIATANQVDTIPRALLDRMEVVRLSGYTEYEKLHIARDYLITRQLRETGLRTGELEFTDAALLAIIRKHTLEPGVRDLERQIGRLCRKVAAGVAHGEDAPGPVVVDIAVLERELGPGVQYLTEIRERTRVPGVAIGLAAAPGGGLGDIIFVEATQMPGGHGFSVTGQLGDVARESAYAALSYVRAQSKSLGLPPDFFDKHDIHLHLPAAAQPKDGPSAGIAMATALVSLFSGLSVRPNVAMTGEITLRGQVLSVGGIKEKALAAHRVGLDTVILPKVDAHQLDELPDDLRATMHFVLVDRVEQALAAALAPPEGEADFNRE